MTRSELRKWNELYDAVDAGNEIEFSFSGHLWDPIDNPLFDSHVDCYRINPIPQYVYVNIYDSVMSVSPTFEKAKEESGVGVTQIGIRYVRAET